MEDTTPKSESAVARVRTATADLLRPVPYKPGPTMMGLAKRPEEKSNYPQALWAGKFLIIAGAVLGATIGVLMVVKQVPTYRADTTLELTAPNTSFLGKGSLDPQAAESYMVNSANIQTQLRIMTGPALIRKAIERVSLESPPIAPPVSGFVSKIRNRFRLIPQDNLEFLRESVSAAALSISARQVGTTHLINLNCDSISADIAASFVNALAAEYISQSQQVRSSAATRTLQWLGTQLEDAKGKMGEADAKLQEFIKRQGLPFVLEQNTLATSKLKDLQDALAASQNERIAKQSRNDLARSSPVDTLPEILDDGSLKALTTSITSLRKERANLTATLTPEHVKVRRIDSEIAELEATLKREKANLVQRIQNDYEAAQKREKLMTSAYNAQARVVASESDGAAQFTALKRDAESSRLAYNQLSDQYNSMELTAAVPTSLGRVIDPATPIHTPLKPQPARDISMATSLGAALVGALLITRETLRVKKLSRVFASPGDTGNALNIPELGIIPAFLSDGSLRKEAPFSLRTLRIGPRREQIGVPDLTSWSKQPFLAESIRHAVTSILVHGNGELHQMLVVTSASPAEGKTTLIGNLGVAMAETGKRVLMVDADLRAPRLHSLFRMDRSNGLSDLYDSPTPVGEIVLQRYVKPTNIANLSLLSSGDMELQRLGEMLFSRRVSEIFSRLRKEYDFVLVDTAPTLQFSDARLLGQFSDGVILIVRSGISSRENVQATAQRIAEDGIPIVGTILNDWQPGPRGSAASNYYYDSYSSYERVSSGTETASS